MSEVERGGIRPAALASRLRAWFGAHAPRASAGSGTAPEHGTGNPRTGAVPTGELTPLEVNSPAPIAAGRQPPAPATSLVPIEGDVRGAAASTPEVAVATSTTPEVGVATSTTPEVAVATTTTSEFDGAVPRGLQIAAAWSWRVIALVAVLWGLLWMIRYLSEVTVPLAVAVLLAAMLSPVTNRLSRWGMPRGAATAVSVLGGLLLIAGALTLIGTQIAAQAGELSSSVVAGFNQAVGWLQNGPLHLSASWFNVDEWGTRISNFLRDSRSTIATYAADIGAQVGHFFAGFAITIFSLFYFLYDGGGIFRFLLKFFPTRARKPVHDAATKGWRALSSYVRATILVALSDAVGVLVVALILGVPVAPALAALVFIGAFVPLVGAFVSGFVAVLVALVALGWVQALIMLGGIIVVMQIEGHLLQPFLLGRAVKLHPLAVLLAIAIGIISGGIVGALLAVPILAFAKSFVQHLSGDGPVPVPAGQWVIGRRRR